MSRVLVIPGSGRKGSLNLQLARLASDAVQRAGAEATLVDLRGYALPLYDGDLEASEGLPAGARALKALFKSHQALLFASPENNSSMSALLKNALDWVSRKDGDESGAVPYRGKVALLTAASPGALGGLRGLRHLRESLEGLGVLVLPRTLAVAAANKAFDAGGQLPPERRAVLDELVAQLLHVARRLAD